MWRNHLQWKRQKQNIGCGSGGGKQERELLVVHVVSACSRVLTDSYDPLKAATESEDWFSWTEREQSVTPSGAVAFSVGRAVCVCVCVHLSISHSEAVNVERVQWCESRWTGVVLGSACDWKVTGSNPQKKQKNHLLRGRGRELFCPGVTAGTTGVKLEARKTQPCSFHQMKLQL